MTTDRIAANRRNCLLSTGPRTAEGKRICSRNSLKHGIYSELRVLPSESAEQWKLHLVGVFESLQPTTYLEQVLAERVAHLLWRMRRLHRYEQAAIASEQDPADASLIERLDRLREGLRRARRQLELLSRLDVLKDDTRLSGEDAVLVLSAVADACDRDLIEFKLPGMPARVEPEDFDGWTVGLTKESIALIARRARSAVEALLNKASEEVEGGIRYREQTVAELEAELGRRQGLDAIPSECVMRRVRNCHGAPENQPLRGASKPARECWYVSRDLRQIRCA